MADPLITLSIVFDGACVFYHHPPDGTDVWISADINHVPSLSGEGRSSFNSQSGQQEISLAGWTVQIVHDRTRKPIPAGKVDPPSRDLIPLLEDFMPNTPYAKGLPDVAPGQLPACLAAHLRLGKGSIVAGTPNPKKRYATSCWTFPSVTVPHAQQLISNAIYLARDLTPPVRFVLRRGNDEEWFEPTVRDGTCTATLEIRDTKDSQPIREVGEGEGAGLAFLDEFNVLLRCFEDPALDVPYTGRLPDPAAASGPISSSDPLCPEGQTGGGGQP